MTTPQRSSRHDDGKLNVLFVMIPMAIGGAERLVLNLAKHLDRTRFAPSVAWFQQEQPLQEFMDLQIPLHYVPKGPGFDWSTMRRLARLVTDQRIDVVNAHHFMSFFYAYYGTKLANRAALVYTEHSEADVLRATGKWKSIGRVLLHTSDAAVGISEAVTRTLTSHFRLRGGRAHTIVNGVNLPEFDRTPAWRADCRARLGFDTRDILIGHVANFRRNKNHLFLLRGFREIRERHGGAKLLLFGQGYPGDAESAEEEIRNYIHLHDLGRTVHLMGYRADVPDLLAALDLTCLVSYKEGLPLSVLEAMASGLPVIGTDIIGIRDVVEANVNGLLVKPDDVAGLAAALERLVQDPELRGRMGEASRRIARERYAFSRCLEQTEQLFAAVGRRARDRRARVGLRAQGPSTSAT